MGARDFLFPTSVETGPTAHTISLTRSTRVVSGGLNVRELALATSPHPVLMLILIAAMPVLPICAFISCRRMNFTWLCTLVCFHYQLPSPMSFLLFLSNRTTRIQVFGSHQNWRKVSFYGCTLQKYKLHLQVACSSVTPYFHASGFKLWCVMAFRARWAWHEN